MNLCDESGDFRWLYRGVPAESEEVGDVENCREIVPRRPGRIGVHWARVHCSGNTDTGYTSWTTDRSIAEAAAYASAESSDLSGRIRIFRVRIAELDPERIVQGRDDEYEYLLEGTVENVRFSDSATDEEDDDD